MKDDYRELVEALETRIHYRFEDATLALTSLTHSSWVNEHHEEKGEDNERLEFLGDAVIDLAVSQALMESLPDLREGPLSQLRASLVNADILSEVAVELDLGPLMRLGKGEDRTGGRRKVSLLSNCLEAVIGAVYLESGLEPIKSLVERVLMPKVSPSHGVDLWDGWDYKTRLQERAQLILGATPCYRVFAETGPDHEKRFEVEALVADEVLGRGEGRTKKEAEQLAARVGIEELEKRNRSGGETNGRDTGLEETPEGETR